MPAPEAVRRIDYDAHDRLRFRPEYALSGDDKFIASVEPGETFVVECAINANDGTIRHLGQQLTAHMEAQAKQ